MTLGPHLPVFRFERWLKALWAAGFGAVAVGFTWLGFFSGGSGAMERMISQLGLWSARLLLVTLALSPLSRLWRAPWMRRWRRTLGLTLFAFAAAHTLLYLFRAGIFPDHMGILVRKPYLIAGLIGLILLAPMAATSNRTAVQGLTPKVWRALHLMVYPAALLVVAHQALYSHDSYYEITASGLAVIVFIALRLRRGADALLATPRKTSALADAAIGLAAAGPIPRTTP